jgi:hypothetical protein
MGADDRHRITEPLLVGSVEDPRLLAKGMESNAMTGTGDLAAACP